MGKLTYQERKRLRPSSFAIDSEERRYPIHNIAHARNALARVAQHGTLAEQVEVRNKVYERYPSLRPTTVRLPKLRSVRITPKRPRLRR